MSHEHELPQGVQIPGGEWSSDPRFEKRSKVINSLPEPARGVVVALSSILLGVDVGGRIKAHTEHGEYERRALIDQCREANMNKRQIRLVFRHYGLKVPKDGLKNRKSS